MSVYVEGDAWVMEQLGHRQEFEAQLGRRGFRHEDFTLHVWQASPLGPKSARTAGGYAVRVTHIPTRRSTIYRAGPRDDWVARFKEDLSMGVFGHPSVLHGAALRRKQNVA
jgi:hypothetical protein